MNFLKAGMHKLPEYMQLRQAVESNALPAVATGLSGNQCLGAGYQQNSVAFGVR